MNKEMEQLKVWGGDIRDIKEGIAVKTEFSECSCSERKEVKTSKVSDNCIENYCWKVVQKGGVLGSFI